VGWGGVSLLLDGTFVHHRSVSQLRLLPIYAPGRIAASGVRCLIQGHYWILARFSTMTFWLWVRHSTDHQEGQSVLPFATEEQLVWEKERAQCWQALLSPLCHTNNKSDNSLIWVISWNQWYPAEDDWYVYGQPADCILLPISHVIYRAAVSHWCGSAWSVPPDITYYRVLPRFFWVPGVFSRDENSHWQKSWKYRLAMFLKAS
jgi:hypothetical protein